MGDAVYTVEDMGMHGSLHWVPPCLNEQTAQKSGLHSHTKPKNEGYGGRDAVNGGRVHWQHCAGQQRVSACYPWLDIAKATNQW